MKDTKDIGKGILIVGAGLGGLFCGAILAQEGYQVTVLDKHHTAGGGLHSFRRHGYNFDTGMHYVAGFEEGGALRKLCRYLGIFDKLHFAPLDPTAFDVLDVGSDGMQYGFPLGKEAFMDKMTGYFPRQAEALSRYMADLESITAPVDLLHLRNAEQMTTYQSGMGLESLGQFMDRHFDDARLASVLLWNSGLYGGRRASSPAYLHAIISQLFIQGATRFAPSAQHLADSLVAHIVAHGGSVRLQTEVVAARMRDRQHIEGLLSRNGECFSAQYYISTIHPQISLSWFPQESFPKVFRQRIASQKHTDSTFSLFATMKPGSFPYFNSNRFYICDYADNATAPVWEAEGPRSFVLFTPPSGREGDFARSIKISAPISFEPFRKWDGSALGRRGAEYEAFKKQCEKSLLARVQKLFPGIEGQIEHRFSASPLSYQYYSGSVDGANYGFAKDCNDLNFSRLLPRTKVSNFFFSGQNLNMHGILGVPLSAVITCGEIIDIGSLLAKINA